ncbi:MAG: TrmH family RNA methyltransferase [Erysipelotrichaceae bacterium]|nr:TrmH family RNA methyltransferase [Erysipelotrichaceae bacterium]
MELGRIYRKTSETSYALGASLTYELLITKPEIVLKVYFHGDFKKSDQFEQFRQLCHEHDINYENSDRVINRLSKKENCYVIAEFIKFIDDINTDTNHLVLVNPGNMGNLGTIIRTAVGFNVYDIVMIRPAVDIFDPKTIRASMGAIFHCRFTYFSSFEEYIDYCSKREIFVFRLNAAKTLSNIQNFKYSLVFGNESTGLPQSFDDIGVGLRIAHSCNIDSLSLPIAVGIALFAFSEL